MENLARKWSEIRIAAIFTSYSGYTLGPVGTDGELLKTVNNSPR